MHRAALAAFPHRQLRGFTTFAPPDAASLISVAASATGILVALNAEKLANADPRVRQLVNANLGYPDGMGAVLALRRHGLDAQRIAGADLWKRIVAEVAGDRSVFLLGGAQEVIETTARRLEQEYPSIQLSFRNGYFREGEVPQLELELARLRPGIVLVGIGSPRQEILMDRLYTAHPAVYVGVGGSFDVFVGRKPRAPVWAQKAGLEWAYQFVRNPRRLHRLPAYLKFAALLAGGRV